MTALRLAVFDLDGTLVDSRANIIRAVEEVARILALPCPHIDVIPRVIGLSLDEALVRLFPEVDAATHKALEAEYRAAFVRLRASPGYDEPLFAGTQDLLTELNDAGVLLGIATGKAPRGVRHLLDRHKLHDRFVTIHTPDTARGKPHPDMVLQAMAGVGARPENTVMIGDTTFDIEMGRAAGARAIGVSWGNHPVAELTAAGAHRLVERMADLAQAVHDLTSPLFTAQVRSGDS
jgi:phosphoglycolate phosphatase